MQGRDRAWLVRGELTGVELLRCSCVTGTMLGQVVLDLDATLETGHSDKKCAEGNSKGRLRLPLMAVVANLPAVQGAACERLGIG